MSASECSVRYRTYWSGFTLGGRIHHSGEFLRPAAGGPGRGIRRRIRILTKLLLDTCTFLWIAQDSSELSLRAPDVFADPANDIYLSAVSAWEIAVKHALGRLPLPEAPDRYVPQLRARHGIESLALDEDAVMQIAKLPGHHRDPFDRMLVCQALAHGFTLLTPDPLISRYPVRTAW